MKNIKMKKYNPLCNNCEFKATIKIGGVYKKQCQRPNKPILGCKCPIKNNKCKYKVKRINFIKRWYLKKTNKYIDYINNKE